MSVNDQFSTESSESYISNETLDDIVSNYLKCRNYNFCIFKKTLTPEDHILTLLTEKKFTNPNSFLYRLSNNYKLESVLEHFHKWLKWSIDLEEKLEQNEIVSIAKAFLYHTYLDLLTFSNSAEQYNNEFKLIEDDINDKIKKKIINFELDQNTLELSEQLRNNIVAKNLFENSHVIKFRAKKYFCKLTIESFHILCHNLINNNEEFLFQVLQKWFDFNIVSKNSLKTSTSETLLNILKKLRMDHEKSLEETNLKTNILMNAELIKKEVIDEKETSSEQNDTLLDIKKKIKLEPLSPTESLEDNKPNISFNDTFEQANSEIPDVKEIFLENLKYIVDEMDKIIVPLFFKISNNQNLNALCCIDMSSNFELIAGGFENSSIYFWHKKSIHFNTFGSDIVKLSCIDDKPRSTNQYMNVLRGHNGAVYDLKFLNKSDILYTVSKDTNMRGWDLKNTCCRSIYSGHNHPIWCLDTSHFGNYIATGSMDTTVKLWSPEYSYSLRAFITHTSDVNTVKFHPSDLYLASGSNDKTIRLFNLNDANCARLMITTNPVNLIEFHPDGLFLASSSKYSKEIFIWDLSSGQFFKSIKIGGLVSCMQWFKKENEILLMVGTEKGLIKIFSDVTKSKEKSTVMDFFYIAECKFMLFMHDFKSHLVAVGL